MIKKLKEKSALKALLMLGVSFCLIISALVLFWISTFRVPTLDSIRERRVAESTKIYDRTGEILLYDTGGNVRRSIISIEEISRHIKNATIAIEDQEFYQHKGVKPTAFIRAILVNLLNLDFSQGGSTITQQVVKNSLLTNEKLVSRKLKEWVLAIKLERVVTKDEILSMYLNEIPYGGVLYGVEEASEAFFGKSSREIGLAEAAYLAAIPKAPTYYSPYGKHKEELEERKNLVLKEMLEIGFITEEEYNAAKEEDVEFVAKGDSNIKAPHFVFYVLDYIKNKYGEEAIETGGLRVKTSLDYLLQNIGEKIAHDYALENEQKFNAENAALVAIDPKTGGILAMVGSRNYFDEEIDGAYNIATAKRQPGSTIKPFVYAEAFIKGYTPETVLFDVPTQFSVSCAPNNFSTGNGCYAPEDYDGISYQPMTLRSALAQSVNIPSVKVLYLAGLKDSINLARDMGLVSLSERGDYGLTLVLGGGEVTPLEITAGYGVFATGGIKTEVSPIIEVKDRSGKVLERHESRPKQVLDKEIALKISDILSDNVARQPLYGPSSALYFPHRDVAVKTGTTNNYRDVWTIGYAPNIVIGAWAGNNDNSPMEKKISGLIVSPMWRVFMDSALANLPVEQFETPLIENTENLKPVLQGIWQGGEFASSTTNQRVVKGGVHTILSWVNKDSPRGEYPEYPEKDPQYERWEYSVRLWAEERNLYYDNLYILN
ncbi:MAG: penicillin-binding protein [Candidatus Zambryskibacteria bacterium]|nr:penicillin-binding protein [Candidatus Zambryskibacteria bacterium]